MSHLKIYSVKPRPRLPTETSGEQHVCITAISEKYSSRPYLYDKPLANSDSISCNPDTSKNQVEYALSIEQDILASCSSLSCYSAQAAALVALTRACEIAEVQIVTLSDSRYAYAAINYFGIL